MSTIYILSAINYNSKGEERSNLTTCEIMYGYFSNLKRAHSVLTGSNLLAYSTIARKIRKRHIVILFNISIKKDKKAFKFNQVIIRDVEVNQLYRGSKSIDLSSMISGEIYRNDLGLLLSI
ncbi:MAG: hypothetical protein WCJ95_21315 [Mariniphaga sp.]